MKYMTIVLATAIHFEPYLAFAQSDSNVRKIFSQNCNSCHRTGGVTGNFDSLTTDSDWLKSPYIVPGSSATSQIMKVLKNNGGSMPPSGALSAADASSIAKWIDGLKTTTTTQTSSSSGGHIYDLTSVNAYLRTYRKCYGQWVNRLPLPSDPRVLKIRNKSMTGPHALVPIQTLCSKSPMGTG